MKIALWVGTTAEPIPAAASKLSAAAMFVVQKHTARRAGLHWDIRLEQGGALWSWAVWEGPFLNLADRRVAVPVEDHPIGYANFQGTVADGQYGAGIVETWDRGTLTALENPEKGMMRGSLRFGLSGQRLHGCFTLARLRRDPKKQRARYLIMGHDEFARERFQAPYIERERPSRLNRQNANRRRWRG